MKRLVLLVSIFFMIFMGTANAAFNSGSTGADGAFNPTANTELQLPIDGVFNFTTVNIPSGVTVTFKKNANNTPIYILAQGDVTIAGAINVSGNSSNSTAPGIGGPGGYDGGYGGASDSPGGKGLGPGGGGGGIQACSWWTAYGGGGGFGTNGGNGCSDSVGGPAYGNATLVPLIGGSGGGGSRYTNGGSGHGGGGGGGAILIASSGSITINGSITAKGGDCKNDSGGGSGGSIRLIANAIYGTGAITAKGGSLDRSNKGGQGRIRLEASVNNFVPGTDPPYTYGQPGSVFQANEPSLWITSIAGVEPPTRTGSYSNPDILLPSTTTNPVTVNVSASYIPVGTTVTVSVIPQYGSTTGYDTTLSGTEASSSGSVPVDLSTQYSNVLMAQATFTIQTAMYYDGEKIEKVRVAATMGKESETVYVTESGKEIPAKELKLAGLVK